MHRVPLVVLAMVVGWFSWGAARADENRVQPLAALAAPESWQTDAGAGVGWAVTSTADRLAVALESSKPGDQAELRLKEPIPVPAWATGFTLLGAKDPPANGVKLRVAVRDATGREYYLYTTSAASFQEGFYFGSRYQTEKGFQTMGEVRFTTPALANLLTAVARL